MKPSDRPRFTKLITDVQAFYRRDVSDFALGVWWQACQAFDIDAVTKALTQHAMEPEQGRFAPMPADIVKQLQGTRTDRSLIAWGKVLDAIQRVGAYRSVVFDDGIIHAVIEDLGGWIAVCRGEIDQLPFLQGRFTKGYQAYAQQPQLRYPAKLLGECEINNRTRGHETQPPALVGDPAAAQAVLAGGSDGPKTQITMSAPAAPDALASLEGIKRIGRAA